MTTLELPDLEARPEPRRDQWGRYLIVPAQGGKARPYTRATTWAKALDDMEGLINWSMRMTALGLVQRPDLYAQVAACRPDDKALKALAEDAKEAGGGSTGRNIGSALHAFTERVDLGETVTVPDPWKKDIDAYRQALADAHLEVIADYVERVVVVEDLGVAGTFDRIYRTSDGRLVIGDVKTGQTLDFSRMSIAVQLALYANADTLYNLGTEAHEPMVDVDKATGLVVHLPSGQGRCEIEEFDIAWGWERVQLAGQVRASRSEARRKGVVSRPYKPGNWPAIVPPEPAIVPPELVATDPQPIGAGLAQVTLRAWIVGRLAALDGLPAAKRAMKDRWPTDMPKLSSGHEHAEAELRRLAGVLDAVERDFSVPFGQPDPTVPPPATWSIAPADRVALPPVPDEGWKVETGEVETVTARLDAIEPAVRAVLGGWAKEAHAAGRTFSIKLAPSQRRIAIYEALLELAPLVDEDLERVRATVAAVVPGAAMPAVALGPVIGALTIAEAGQLRDVALAVRSDEPPIVYDLQGGVHWATPTTNQTNDNEQDNS